MTPATSPGPLGTSTAVSTWRKSLRIAFVIALATFSICINAPDLAAPWHPWGSFGFDASADGRITQVYPNMPAARAGIHPGDRVDLAAVDSNAVRSLGPFAMAWPGTSRVFPMRQPGGRDRFVRLTSVPWPRSAADNISDFIAILAQIAFVLVPAWLVLTRPSMLTWSFFLFAVGGYAFISSVLMELMSARTLHVMYAATTILYRIGTLGFATFALLFPRLRPDRGRARVLTALGALTAVMIGLDIAQAVMAAYDYAGTIGFSSVVSTAGSIYAVAMYLLGIAFFIFNYIHAPAVDRPRIRWVIVGFAAAFAGLQLVSVAQTTPAIAISPPVWAINVLQSFGILAPISVAYAIVTLRVIDVRFVLSRALVYGLLTTAAVAMLAVLDFVVARQLEQTQLGLLVELGGAVAVGLCIQRAHTWIDDLVDRFVFRSIHDAEKHFRTIGRAMRYARSAAAIDTLVCEEAVRALHLAGAAVYHAHDDGTFTRTFATGAPFRDGFDRDHRVILHLLAERTPIEHDGELAVPLIVRDSLLGFALYGAHTNGTAIDPNERELLERLCTDAATACDHVAGEERAGENARLRNELTILQARYDEVRSLVDMA